MWMELSHACGPAYHQALPANRGPAGLDALVIYEAVWRQSLLSGASRGRASRRAGLELGWN